MHKDLQDQSLFCKGRWPCWSWGFSGWVLPASLYPAIWKLLWHTHSVGVNLSLAPMIFYYIWLFPSASGWLAFSLYLLIYLAWFWFEYPVCQRWRRWEIYSNEYYTLLNATVCQREILITLSIVSVMGIKPKIVWYQSSPY